MRTFLAARFIHALAATASVATPMQGQTNLPHTIFLHGAGGYLDGVWENAIASLTGSYAFPLGYAQANVPNSTSMWGWYSYFVNDVITDTSVMAGYSLGGLASRHVTNFKNLRGLISVGSPHTGAPIASSPFSAGILLTAMEQDLSRALSVSAGEFLEAFFAIGESLYWDVVAGVDNVVYGAMAILFVIGFGMLNDFPANFDSDLPPGSTFLNQLPTSIPNSYTLSVRMYPGHLRGPLALAEGWTREEADDEGEFIAYWGNQIQLMAYDAQFYIDWGHEHAGEVYDALLAAAQIGGDMVNLPLYWCGAVTSGNVFGGCSFSSDGLIPTSRQTFSGANNVPVDPGPAHTKELIEPGIIGLIGNRLCVIAGNC